MKSLIARYLDWSGKPYARAVEKIAAGLRTVPGRAPQTTVPPAARIPAVTHQPVSKTVPQPARVSR